MSDHKHGEMDIQVQEDTFAGFITAVTRTAIVIILVLLFAYMING
ncbi:aa3-type cytochrome c oxidase subunit IV [Lentibacter sp. XHP0401]|jgi:Bacterial aa3 type cytochrome c oxidase subunit IV|nr:aa3-type cytochrome c oxidase subunit IV [Lentibacter sp. XHP0401]MCV2892927.1 aa3-type cytochrome c oxidase subunit IV [Lentibacter sp. XHP0401]